MAYPEGIEASYHHDSGQEVELQSTALGVADEPTDLREFIALLRRHVLLIIVVTLATGAATYAVTVRQAKQYSSAATLLYAAPANSTQDPAREVADIVGISSSNRVLAPVAARARLTVPALRKLVSITGDPNSDIVTVGSSSGSPGQAATLANGVADALIAYSATGQKDVLRAQIVSLQHQLQAFAGRTDPSSLAAASDLRTQLAEARAQLAVATPGLSVLTPAVPPTAATAPHPARDGVVGLLAGLVLGVMLAALRDRLDRHVRGIDELEALYRVPTLGTVPFIKGRRGRTKMLADFSGSGALADAYRTIRTNLTLVGLNGKGTPTVIVTSAVPEEGKSAVTANLAHALSVMGKSVLAVSADLHNPTLHEYFELPKNENGSHSSSNGLARVQPVGGFRSSRSNGSAGLVEVLAGEVPLSEAVRMMPLMPRERASGGSLALLANASTFFDPAALFGSEPMNAFLKQARQQYDVVILDTPPLLANADASLLARTSDIVVLVARLEHLTKNQARRAVRVMSATHLTPTGIIVTGETDDSDYGYGSPYASIESERPTADPGARTNR